MSSSIWSSLWEDLIFDTDLVVAVLISSSDAEEPCAAMTCSASRILLVRSAADGSLLNLPLPLPLPLNWPLPLPLPL